MKMTALKSAVGVSPLDINGLLQEDCVGTARLHFGKVLGNAGIWFTIAGGVGEFVIQM